MKEQNGALVAVIIFFIGLFIYTKLAGPIPFFVNSVQTSKASFFQADGTGKAAAAPDIAKVSFGVTKNATTVADAQNQVNSNIENILKSLKDLSIEEEDIKTTNYSVYPNYNFNETRQQISGYTVTQNIDVEIKKIDKVNNAVDAITSNGGNLVGQITFDFDKETRRKLEDQARKEAVETAKEKAQSLARASGIRLGKIINVEENTNIRPMPIYADTVGRVGAPAEKATEITPGQSSIQITVILSYEIR
ncbi:MAG: SIMPL domain-containing protein [Candidatus Levybacteria bacterium]|nr:SIMPL domain-containing protein [Candidatus Levybacteria bacterium]